MVVVVVVVVVTGGWQQHACTLAGLEQQQQQAVHIGSGQQDTHIRGVQANALAGTDVAPSLRPCMHAWQRAVLWFWLTVSSIP